MGYRGEIKLKFNLDLGNWWKTLKDEYFQDNLNNGIFTYYQTAEDVYRNFGLQADIYSIGDRIGQLIIIPYPQIEFVEANELSFTERGEDGFGSTGN